MRYVTNVEGRNFSIEIQKDQVVVDGQAQTIDLRRIEPLSLYSLLVGNRSHELLIEEQREEYGVMLQGKLYTVRVQQERARDRAALGSSPPPAGGQTAIDAPMPGRVLETLGHVGQAKQAGDILIIMESMKMQIELRCPQDGVIQTLHVSAQDHVTQGQTLVTLAQENPKRPS